MNYDPNKTPVPDIWLALDEAERIMLSAAYHKRIGAKLPNRRLHATIHVVIENQLAEGIPLVLDTLNRLTADGLDRHDAIHAIGSVLTKHIFHVMKGKATSPDPNDAYFQDLKELTASAWLQKAR